MFWGYKHRDPAIHSRARDQAAWLVRDHGDEAEAVLEAKIRRPNLSRDDEYRFKLTRTELQKLRRQTRTRGKRRSSGKSDGLLDRILNRIFRTRKPR